MNYSSGVHEPCLNYFDEHVDEQ